jgi:hypothetical protein
MGYNPEATKFQFDFLNDSYEKLPKGLRDAIESGKKIIILINPPYATSNNMGTIEGDHKEGISDTKIGSEMKNNKWGASSRNIYAQFLYRIFELQKNNGNIKIALFCKPNYMTASDYKTFRLNFLSQFGYSKGFLFKASHFADVSSQWGISFSIFDSNPNEIKNNFIHDLLDQDENSKIYNLGVKTLYNLDNGIEGSEWVRETNKGKETIDTIQLKSALKPGFSNINRITKTAVTYLLAKSNNVLSNANNVAFLSSSTSNRGGMSIDSENFTKACSLFTARKSIKGDWINDKDEYLSPNIEHEFFQNFTCDSVVYSMFNNSSEQSSLRNVEYKNQLWNIKNEFFWMSKNEIGELANVNGCEELHNDARTDSDRYVHTLLFGEEGIYDQLSDEAKDVLNSASILVRLSLERRREFANDTNQLNSWDAGYAQLKLLWQEYYPEQFKEFRVKYKVLEDKMRPMVYELGFLLK